MLTKIGRKRFLGRYPQFVTANYRTDKNNYPETFDNYILTVDYKSTKGLCKNLSTGLGKLIELLGYNELNFLGDTNIEWLYRTNHEYPPVKLALAYLVDNNISKSFNGAIEVNIKNLIEFTKHFFWLVRCNGVVNIPHFSDAGFNIMGSICQYGNIHLSTLNEEIDIILNEILPKTGLYIYEEKSCGGKRIIGRTITI